ncbi:MAG: FAD-binding oxidoreductase [Pseudohongiellaceae bacterium]|jgi:FAD/FMN-containing dehydrogenase|nr:FAD-binding oxidoreductase [Gammaproteobacteria bacterium]
MSTETSGVLAALSEIVGEDWVKTDPADLQTYGTDWTRQFPVAPSVIVMPKTVAEVQAVVELANEIPFKLVPSGGRTGLSGGAVATDGEVVLVLDRMNQILDFNAADRQVTCEAGVVTEQLQQFAERQGLFYPVDFASSGSSQLGGNVATNAGGIKVIRYGMTRSWVTGMKVVTGRGDLLDLNRGLTKNATGYDFRHLFIGSEGTLGIVVELTMALSAPPQDPAVLILGVEDMTQTMPVLEAFQNRLSLTAFEFFSEQALQHVIAEKNLARPFETASNFYALIEFEQRSEEDLEAAMALFEHCLEQGWIVDGTISQSLTQAESLWRLREDISETIAQFTPYKNDIAVRVSAVPQFLKDVDSLVREQYPEFEIIWFGHIGDGNVHLNILKPENLEAQLFFEQCGSVSNQVFSLVQQYGGSVSAEHGVGLLKKPYLNYSRDPQEIEYMRLIKQAFDPNGVLNPGKVFDL